VPEDLLKQLVVNRIDYHFGRVGRHTDIMTRIFKEVSAWLVGRVGLIGRLRWAGMGWDTASGKQALGYPGRQQQGAGGSEARADYEAALGRPWDAAQRTVAKMEIGTGLPGWQAAPA
jgi:hypothetical protein